MEMGNLEEAFRCMQRALENDPNNSAYYNSMAMLLVRQERYAEATEWLQRALRFNPNDGRARFNLALAMFKLEDYEGAIRTFMEVPHKDVEHVHAYYYLAAAEWSLGNHDRAAEHAAMFLKFYGRDDEFTVGARQMLKGP
jgi:tetratricopeptide (TPR) repeat protein